MKKTLAKRRTEAENYINEQLQERITDPDKVCWHYGRVELNALLDHIYGPYPTIRKMREIFPRIIYVDAPRSGAKKGL